MPPERDAADGGKGCRRVRFGAGAGFRLTVGLAAVSR